MGWCRRIGERAQAGADEGHGARQDRVDIAVVGRTVGQGSRPAGARHLRQGDRDGVEVAAHGIGVAEPGQGATNGLDVPPRDRIVVFGRQPDGSFVGAVAQCDDQIGVVLTAACRIVPQLDRGAQQGGDHRLQGRGLRCRLRDQRVKCCRPAAVDVSGPPVDHLGIKPVLAFEVIVDQRLVDTGALGDRPHRGAGKAGLREHGFRRVQYRRPRAFGSQSSLPSHGKGALRTSCPVAILDFIDRSVKRIGATCQRPLDGASIMAAESRPCETEDHGCATPRLGIVDGL